MNSFEIIKKINNNENFRYSNSDGSFTINSVENSFSQIVEYDIIIRLTEKCNYNCVYCGLETQGITPFFVKILKAIIKNADLSKSRFIISGGEPSISKNFLQFFDMLIKSNCSQVTIQSNASIFSNNSFFSQIELIRKYHFSYHFLALIEKLTCI